MRSGHIINANLKVHGLLRSNPQFEKSKDMNKPETGLYSLPVLTTVNRTHQAGSSMPLLGLASPCLDNSDCSFRYFCGTDRGSDLYYRRDSP